MRPEGDWETYLRARFPGYLLPESAANALTADQASRFLESLTGRADCFDLLRAASFLAPRAEQLSKFVAGPLSDLLRGLPSRTQTSRREWQGGYHGRLHIGETLAMRLEGRATSFVTMVQERRFDLPENVFLRAVCARLLALLVLVRKSDVLREGVGWGEALRGCEGTLRRQMTSTALREVPERRTTVFDENAARAARHGGYHEAVAWAVALAELEDGDPAKIARVVAEGALLPLSDATRFELAVTMRLAEALGEELDAQDPGRWRCERGLIVAKRAELFAFVRSDGVAVRVFYNQEVLPSGAVYAGARHYLGNQGGLRPDVVVTFDKPGQPRNAVVIECKHSANPGYLLEGFHEAVLYRTEYAEHLRGRLKAILVASSQIAGSSRADDDVVAADWSTWPPRMVVEELVGYARSA